jgi:hypothetical protein
MDAWIAGTARPELPARRTDYDTTRPLDPIEEPNRKIGTEKKGRKRKRNIVWAVGSALQPKSETPVYNKITPYRSAD